MSVARRDRLVAIWRETVAALSGENLVREALASPDAVPRPGSGGRLVVLALGKAAASMCRGAEEVLGPLEGLAVGPAGDPPPGGLVFLPGDHPVPGAGSRAAGVGLLAAVAAIRPRDAVLLLLSGGASALAEAPAEGLSLADLAATTRLLLGAGATIAELNAVRRHLSRLKGGRLGAAIPAGETVVLAISDVAGNDPAAIGSGPFSPDPTTFADALDVLRRRAVIAATPPAVRLHLEGGARGEREETPKPGDARLDRIDYRILAGPSDLPRHAVDAAARAGFRARFLGGFLGGDVGAVTAGWIERARSLAGEARGSDRPLLVAAAAEPTVTLPEHPGRGGRARQLALGVALGIEGLPAAFLAAGSDGRDGSPEAAGAVIDGGTVELARTAGLDLAAALERADSGAALERLGLSVPGADTGTNLADLNLLAAGCAPPAHPAAAQAPAPPPRPPRAPARDGVRTRGCSVIGPGMGSRDGPPASLPRRRAVRHPTPWVRATIRGRRKGPADRRLPRDYSRPR